MKRFVHKLFWVVQRNVCNCTQVFLPSKLYKSVSIFHATLQTLIQVPAHPNDIVELGILGSEIDRQISSFPTEGQHIGRCRVLVIAINARQSVAERLGREQLWRPLGRIGDGPLPRRKHSECVSLLPLVLPYIRPSTKGDKRVRNHMEQRQPTSSTGSNQPQR